MARPLGFSPLVPVSDLGEYLNPNMKDLPISALVAANPISASRFIENKRKAFIDFIMSSNNPIGKVTHYFCRREYQGRGLQSTLLSGLKVHLSLETMTVKKVTKKNKSITKGW